MVESSLLARAQEFTIRAEPSELPPLLNDCIADGGAQALAAVQTLFEDPYGGLAFDYELKAPAALCLIHWGGSGVRALVEAALRSPTFKNLSIAMTTLATVGTDTATNLVGLEFAHQNPAAFIREAVEAHPALRLEAREQLGRLILAVEDEDTLITAVSTSIQSAGFYDPTGAKQIFAALARRWLTVSQPVLSGLSALVSQHPEDEPKFQSYFERFPQILDPMAFQVWPQPDLHGFREPDFLIRRTDDSYLIVEIETPAKLLITSSRHLGRDASHAVSQVNEYRRHLMERQREAREHFPGFRDPECLVVIGLESSLDEAQLLALQSENQSRSSVRIVGFDWLIGRAEAISRNLVTQTVELRRIRYV